MPPKSKNNHDDKSETASVKDRNGHGNHHTSGGSKLRRVASSSGSQRRDATKGHSPTTAVTQPTAPASPPGLTWSTFDRDVLHDYRHEFHIDTPTAFTKTYHQWVLSRPGIGLHSPTMARRREYRRQSKEELAKVVRKHFNALGIQENDVVVGFLHKIRNPGVVKFRRNKDLPHKSPMP